MSNELVKYDSYDPETAKQETREMGQKDYVKLEVGKNRVRYLPGPVGSRSPFTIFQEHRVQVAGQKFDVRFVCPGKGCPVCIESSRLNKTGNPRDRDVAYKLSAKPRALGIVISRREPERGPLVHEFGKKIHTALSALLDPDVGGDFTNPIEGFDIIIQREGTGQTDTKYEVFRAKNASQLAESVDQMNEWLEARPDLTQYIPPTRSIEEIKKMMSGGGGTDTDDDIVPAGKSGGGKKPRTADDDLA